MRARTQFLNKPIVIQWSIYIFLYKTNIAILQDDARCDFFFDVLENQFSQQPIFTHSWEVIPAKFGQAPSFAKINSREIQNFLIPEN